MSLSRYLDRLSVAHAPIITLGLMAFSFSRGWKDSTRGTWHTMAEGALCAVGFGIFANYDTLGAAFASTQSRLLSVLRTESALLQTFVLSWFVRANRLCGAPAPQRIPPLLRWVGGTLQRRFMALSLSVVRFPHLLTISGSLSRLSQRLSCTGAFLFPAPLHGQARSHVLRHAPGTYFSEGGMPCAFTPA